MYERGSPYGAFPARLNPHHPLNRGLKGWWLVTPPLDGGSRWYDLVGSFPGALNGLAIPWRGSAQRWGSLQLDGSTNFVSISSAVQQASSRVFTYACWAASSSATINQMLMWEGSSTSTTPLFQFKFGSPATNLTATIRDDAAHLVTLNGATTINDGKWHHLAVTGDGANIALYVDGKSDATPVSIATVGTMTCDRVTFGAATTTTTSSYFPGQLDDCRIYTRPLSAAEVYALYLESLAGYPEALLYWRSPRVFYSVPSGGSTGAGAVTLGGLAAAGSASFTAPASGAVALGGIAATGAGVFTAAASGAIALGAIVAAGTGTFTASGATASGAITLGAVATAGTGRFTAIASGPVALGGLAAAGSGAFIASAAGSVVLAGLGVSGVGTGGGAPVPLAVYPDPFAATASTTVDPFRASSRLKGA